MGLGFGCRSSCGDSPVRGNPIPSRYTVRRVQPVGRNLVAMLNYPDAINFEGNKILVFEDMTIQELDQQTAIDPHFTKFGKLLARFRPTRRGWEAALIAAEMFRGGSDD